MKLLRHQLQMVSAAVAPHQEDANQNEKKVTVLRSHFHRVVRRAVVWARSPQQLVWPVIGSLLAVAVSLIWLAPKEGIPEVFDPNRPQALYILSSAAQALAAILALVFTMVLIVAQLSSSYSNRMIEGFFDRTTIAYILLFVISVFFSLYYLCYPTVLVVKISLTLSACCLFLLLPYFLSFRYRLNPEMMLERLYDESYAAIGSHAEPTSVQAIDNAMMSALSRKD
jgi:uncharacterized membrane protein